MFRKLILYEPDEYSRFSDSRVSNDDSFEKVVVLFDHSLQFYYHQLMVQLRFLIVIYQFLLFCFNNSLLHQSQQQKQTAKFSINLIIFDCGIFTTKILYQKDTKSQSGKTSKPNKDSIQLPKKSQKQLKKEQKKEDKLKQQEKQKIKSDALKGKGKIKNTLKNQIRKDPRLAERPKFPMSPYFLYLKQMRSNILQNTSNHPTSKQFAEQMGKNWREMSQQKKSPYISEYLKSRRIYDDKMAEFYAKYPDLKPKNSQKNPVVMYSVDDPKYQTEPVVIEEPQLENDLIDELESQEDGCKDTQVNIDGQVEEKKKLEDSLTLSDERIPLGSPTTGKSPLQAVEID